jgi:hypothetical protein
VSQSAFSGIFSAGSQLSHKGFAQRYAPLLHAFEQIEYINASPDTLYFLYFHLWPNAYSDNNTDLAKQLFRVQREVKVIQ